MELIEEELGSRARLMCGLFMMQCENWVLGWKSEETGLCDWVSCVKWSCEV